MKKKSVQLLCALILVVAAFASHAEAGGGPFCPIDPDCAYACQQSCTITVCGGSYPICNAPGMHEAIGACAEACARPGCCL